MDLDSPQSYDVVDPADALGDVEATARQWAEAASLGPGPLDLRRFDAVVISGMGGSGITGDIIWALSLERYALPVVVHKGYRLPGFTGPRTLVVALSHSGATEETLSAFEEAGRRGAARLVVTSGEALAERAAADGAHVALVPGGTRPPRHSLGVLLVPTLVALGLDDGLDEAVAVMDRLGREQGRDVPTAGNAAKELARRVALGVVPLAWGGRGIGSVAAYRLKCQLNENAKIPAVHGELPEADHNDVVGWESPSPLRGLAAMIILRDPVGEHPRVTRRFELTTQLLSGRLAWTADVVGRGQSALARLASLLFQADLVSVYTALAADRDPTPITSIDQLKSRLGSPAGVQ
ncbi:MAG: bifunctional phosphoglucose/phosphomannose isomerase [Nitriliruptorales bacterium]|nr:bifunctional phosphoglucose/phosphomannose isomerase [Nitriliruptorales bacterium]